MNTGCAIRPVKSTTLVPDWTVGSDFGVGTAVKLACVYTRGGLVSCSYWLSCHGKFSMSNFVSTQGGNLARVVRHGAF